MAEPYEQRNGLFGALFSCGDMFLAMVDFPTMEAALHGVAKQLASDRQLTAEELGCGDVWDVNNPEQLQVRRVRIG